MQGNTTGGLNTASGSFALKNNTTGAINTASGVDALASNITGDFNTASGNAALFSNTTGNNNTASGWLALSNNITGSSNTALGVGADVSATNLHNATAIGAGARVNASNKVRLGNDDITVIAGKVGFTAESDRNRKENLLPVEGEDVLAKLRTFSLSSWNYIGQDPKQFRHYGPMAQDFFAAFGYDGIGTIGTETTITSTDIDGILMIAAQALEKRTTEQNQRAMKQEKTTLRQAKQIDALTSENAQLRQRLEALERRLSGDVRRPAVYSR